jgi:hypothetical protein
MPITFRIKLGSWILLSDALKQRLAEMPDLAEGQAQLEALITEAQGLASRQAELTGELSKIVRRRQEAEVTGEELRQRLIAAVQYKIGFKDEDLRAFGAIPRKRRRKGSSPAPAPGAPAPAKPAAAPATDTPPEL